MRMVLDRSPKLDSHKILKNLDIFQYFDTCTYVSPSFRLILCMLLLSPGEFFSKLTLNPDQD